MDGLQLARCCGLEYSHLFNERQHDSTGETSMHTEEEEEEEEDLPTPHAGVSELKIDKRNDES
jgi:hypothetical protein